MQVHYSMDHLPEIPFPVVTIGSFDGVHVGHRAIIQRLNDIARLAGGKSVLVTFHPHPRKILYPNAAGKDLKLINSRKEKCMLLEEAGLDHLIILEFTRSFAKTTSQSFVEDYLVGKLHAHTIVVGFNHYFGHNKEGSYESLYCVKERYGYQVEEIPEKEIQNESVSSTRIRKALSDGNIQRANASLGHHYMVHAILEQNRSVAENLGHICFDIITDDQSKLIPSGGAYAVSYECDGTGRKGMAHISDQGIRLFPLESSICPKGGPGTVRFHKRIALNENLRLERELRIIEELIY
ncbi:MAG: hypothetical protein KAR19_09735 [Bacteroidales bacterium]|nr:hypothetical protein [Bacteroidales bacterium]